MNEPALYALSLLMLMAVIEIISHVFSLANALVISVNPTDPFASSLSSIESFPPSGEPSGNFGSSRFAAKANVSRWLSTAFSVYNCNKYTSI